MIPFIDLKTQYLKIEDKIKNRINNILEHGQYIMGPEVKELETDLCNYIGTKHSIGCASGTDALILALLALDIKAGDEVIVPDFTFFGTAEVVSLIGATPVFVDIDPDTYNLDPVKANVAVTNKTKAIIPVSLYGLTADLDAFMKIAKEHGISIIEDGAQSFGATYKVDNKIKASCNIATISTTSFYPAKPLGAYGDAGAVFTNDDELALKMRQLLNHGQESGYHHIHIGLNGRIDTIQAAILVEKLSIFKNEITLRNQVASNYHRAFEGKVKMQKIPEGHTSSWAQFTIEVDDRDSFREKMQKNSIPTAVHYPSALSDQPIYKDKFTADTPQSKLAASRVVSLPMNPYLSSEHQSEVIENVLKSI